MARSAGGVACPLQGCCGKIYMSVGTRKKPGCFRNHKSLAYFLRIIQSRTLHLVVCQPEEKGPMLQGARTRSEERLPLSTAILSNIALSLLMRHIALKLASLLLAAGTGFCERDP